MTGVMTLYRSSIGKKVLMAVTGLLLIAFVFIHMWGNLKVYQGADYLNAYAGHLRLLGEPIFGYEQALWIARIVLLAAVGIHIAAAAQLWKQSNDGRPVGYKEYKGVQPAYTYASYTMRWGGIVIALFIIFHILHFTLGVVGYGLGNGEFIHPESVITAEGELESRYYAYENVVNGFEVWYISLFYIIAQIALGFHIFHGGWSMFQTLGWNNGGTTGLWRGLALLLAVAIVVGTVSIPVAVMAGWVQ
jgi:succinate dehydrogenase / fumarate reductase cytochrome b subunit